MLLSGQPAAAEDEYLRELSPEQLAAISMEPTWPDVEFSEIRAYVYFPGGGKGADPILQDQKLHPAVADKDGKQLDAGQQERLLKIIRPAKPAPAAAGCYLPHHGFVFYGEGGKAVADISVCLLCEMGKANPGEKSISSWNFAELKKLITDLGLPAFASPAEAIAYYEQKVKPRAKD